MARSILGGLGGAIVWYFLVLYVLPFPRMEQIFWERGLTSVIISLVGFCGISSALNVLIKRRALEKKVIQTLSAIEHNRRGIELIEHCKKSMTDKVLREYEYLSLFPTLCVSLGFLGTVIGIAGGIEGLSSVFANTGDMIVVREGIFKLVASLGLAFDSTLLGLIFSIIIVMMITIGKKWSLKTISERCNAKTDEIILSDKGEIAMAPQSDVSALAAPAIRVEDVQPEKIEKYIEVMTRVGENLASLMEMEKKLANYADQSSVFSTLNEHLRESNMVFKAILKFLKDYTAHKAYRSQEELREEQ